MAPRHTDTQKHERTALEAAQVALSHHLAHCPGDYLTCAENGTLDSRRAWLLKRDLLAGDVKMARQGDLPVRTIKPAAEKPKVAVHPSPFRKTVDDYLTLLVSRIQTMNSVDCRSKEWDRAKASALHYRSLVRSRAHEDGVEIPPLPTIPTIPEEQKLRPGMTLGSIITPDTPEHRRAKERERGIRRRAAAKNIDAPMAEVESGRGPNDRPNPLQRVSQS